MRSAALVSGAQAAPEGPALETYANNSSPGARRRVRYQRRCTLWRASTLARTRKCGRVARGDSVTLRRRENVAGFAGLTHCGSVWSCPVCAGRILVHRALEIGAVLGRAMEAGHALGFVTLTMRHDRSQPLADLFKAASKGWARVTSGKAWTLDQADVDGWVRVWEVTHGRNGWHVHVHLVLVMSPGSTSDTLDGVATAMYGRWSRSLEASGLRAPRLVGQDWHLVAGDQAATDLAGYLAKMADAPDVGVSLGLELTHSQPGRAAAARRTRPVWALLDDLVQTGEASALRLWHEWEKASKGKRQVGWSAGIRERFAPEVEDIDDQAVVDAEVGTADDDVLVLDLTAWRQLLTDPGRILLLLEATEGGGKTSATSLLDWWRIPWTDPVPKHPVEAP